MDYSIDNNTNHDADIISAINKKRNRKINWIALKKLFRRKSEFYFIKHLGNIAGTINFL